MAGGNMEDRETEMRSGNGEAMQESDGDLGSAKKCDLGQAWNTLIWHGGSIYDAWLNAVAAQVGSVILTLPYTLSQMGYGLGIGFQILYGAFGCWTVYLLSIFYAEAAARTRKTGILHQKHILQYHEVIGIVAGKWFGRVILGFNMTSLTFACVLQLIACSSDVYYMNSDWNKRQWLYLFGALALPAVLLPSLHNFRVVSLLGIATTTLTSAYMTVAAIQHGQIENVRHQGPKSMVQFFSGATNILFSFGSHGLCIELMEAMWKPKNYKYAYMAAVLYTYLLTVPDSVAVYWAYGDTLLHNSNAFGVLPHSTMKNVAIIAMILHQYVAFMLNVNPLFLAWEKLLGVHTSKRFAVKAAVRIPIVLVIWFLALAIPFFGPINSVLGAFLISFSVYIVPSIGFMKVYIKGDLKEMPREKMQRKGKVMFGISAFVALWVFVIGFGFGGWASMTNFSRQINSFGFFSKCYQCPKKS
uniref:Amino acid transporter transmembrane domain-containing protein n=1 Tax=Araucaria cunninghamii TaxID=56994 RepID=A0A0D6R7N8_ARACU